ncbi:MAG: CBS domain-containing protein, partial [Vulcanibacillus sp.]
MTKDKNDPKSINYSSILQEIQPFSYLSLEVLDQLVPKIERKVFPVDSYIFRQGDESKKILFIVVSGLAEISVKNNKGESFVLDYRNRSSFFGETVVLSNKSYVATVKCLTELDCLLIKSKDIEFLIETNGTFANLFNMMVADHFYNLINKIPTEQGIMKGLITYENQGAQKRASELMNSPVITCSPTDKINQVAKKMSTNHVSSIVIVNNDGNVCGSITEKDLVEKVIAKNLSPDNHYASEISTKDPLCLSPDSFYYQILLAMTKEKVKHAIVTEDNTPIGIITIRDLIRSRNSGVISVIDRLETQSKLSDLALVGQEIEQVLNGLMMEKAPIPEILDIITEFYDRVTRQVIDLSIEKMSSEFGPPPVKFCWLTMGSGGRREQFLRTDQDNALIYETVADVALAKKA